MGVYRTALLAITLAGFVAGCEQRTDRDAVHRTTGELLVQSAILQIHWQGLETNKDFKPVVEDLISDFSNNGHDVGILRPAVNNPSEQQKPRNDFERKLLLRWTDTKQPDDSAVHKTSKEVWFYKPIYVDRDTCVACHRVQNGNENLVSGDLQGVIRVRVDAKK